MGESGRIALPAAPAECGPQLVAIERLARALQADERVQACWLHGSFGAGTADRHSDVDLEAAASMEAVAAFAQEPLAVLAQGGTVLFHLGGSTPQFARAGAVYAGPLVADLGMYATGAGPIPRGGVALHVLFDRTGLLRRPGVLCEALPQAPEVHRHEVEERLSKFWFWAYTALRLLRRGNLPWASGFLSDMRATLAQLLWLRDHPGASIGFPVACGWGTVRTDLAPAAAAELGACIAAGEAAELGERLGQCMGVFAGVGREVAARLGCAYPEALEAEVLAYAAESRSSARAAPGTGGRPLPSAGPARRRRPRVQRRAPPEAHRRPPR